ncbi:MAG: Mce-associated rane protein [Mycobacterium sp.]|jgi:Mce-associated membrane protein|nr:Mce-associated rane protein [Mycobacterium sp.]
MEGDAGTSQLNPTDAHDSHIEPLSEATDETAAQTEPPQEVDGEPAATRRAERLGRGAVLVSCLLLVLLAGGTAVGGYFARSAHGQAAQYAIDEAAAVRAARDCVTVTQAPDTTVMSASQAKMIECSTGDFATQAVLYSGILADAYQAASVKVQITDMSAAAERQNADGTVDVLVAFRVKVSNMQAADQEQGYRLRVHMAPVDGTFKVAKLEQVTS